MSDVAPPFTMRESKVYIAMLLQDSTTLGTQDQGRSQQRKATAFCGNANSRVQRRP